MDILGHTLVETIQRSSRKLPLLPRKSRLEVLGTPSAGRVVPGVDVLCTSNSVRCTVPQTLYRVIRVFRTELRNTELVFPMVQK